MEIIKSILLGIVQGLTEFLPISSSGHLEIFKVILGFETGLNNNILFTLILHLATSFKPELYENMLPTLRRVNKPELNIATTSCRISVACMLIRMQEELN